MRMIDCMKIELTVKKKDFVKARKVLKEQVPYIVAWWHPTRYVTCKGEEVGVNETKKAR